MKFKHMFIVILVFMTLAASALALDFTVTCPDSVNSGDNFDCLITMPTAPAGGLTGLSFTVNTGAATLNSVGFASGLINVSVPPKYGFFTTNPITLANTLLATINLQTGADFTLVVAGLRATTSSSPAPIPADQLSFNPEMVTMADVAANRPPVLTPIGPQTVRVGETLTFTVSATDADGDTLTFSGEDMPDTATIDSNTGVFSWIPTVGNIGEHSVSLMVYDGGVEVSIVVIITVQAADERCTSGSSRCVLGSGQGIGYQRCDNSAWVDFDCPVPPSEGQNFCFTVNNGASCLPPRCGDGVAQGEELCDGAVQGDTCLEQGFTGGTLSCASDCTFDTSRCTLAEGSGASGSSCTADAQCAAGLHCINDKCDDVLTQIREILEDEGSTLITKISGIAGVLREFFR